MAKLSGFYQRRGTIVIFVSRFLPMFRAVVPIFAGTSGVGFWRAALPMAVASGLWYGLIVYLGATAGENWEEIRATVESSGKWLAIAAGLALLVGGVVKSRGNRPRAVSPRTAAPAETGADAGARRFLWRPSRHLASSACWGTPSRYRHEVVRIAAFAGRPGAARPRGHTAACGRC